METAIREEPIRDYRNESGTPLPGVTDVLSDMGITDYSAVPFADLEWARVRGSYVHKATHLHDEGKLDWSSLDAEVRPRVEAWRQFRSDTGFGHGLIETRLISKQWGFGGTIDRLGRAYNHGAVCASGHWLVDIKPATSVPGTAIQLAAYSGLLEETHFQPGWMETVTRVSVHLRGDGTYHVKTYPAREIKQDWAVFLGALRVWHWRKKHGLV